MSLRIKYKIPQRKINADVSAERFVVATSVILRTIRGKISSQSVVSEAHIKSKIRTQMYFL